jgi:hypothetical protein
LQEFSTPLQDCRPPERPLDIASDSLAPDLVGILPSGSRPGPVIISQVIKASIKFD